MTENATTQWFGHEFAKLHPLLQQLHQQGGILKGMVDIEFGTGVAGWLGKRIAKKLGVPTLQSRYFFEVEISHKHGKLYWSRTFSDSSGDEPKKTMLSIFEPVGHWPTGYWVEKTGRLALTLTVDVKNGGWYWRTLKTKLGWLKIPAWMMPRTEAWKRIENDQYVFHVELSLPLLGTLLRYRGSLDAVANT